MNFWSLYTETAQYVLTRVVLNTNSYAYFISD